jgi:hypothetical protein
MSGIPDSIRVKIERANHHIKDLEVEISRFLNSGPYKTIGEMDAERRPTYRISNVHPVPAEILAITGDAIQNLRSSLDYLTCALWSRTNSGECERIQFPCVSAANYKTYGLGEIKGMRKDAIDAIRAVEPYEGGKGDILWRLHRLSIIDKHRLPIAIAGGNMGINFQIFYPELFPKGAVVNPWNLFVGDMRFSLKDNDVLFRDDPGRELKQDVHFPFFVAFDELGIFERQPLLPALNRISDFVSKTVSGFASLFA